MKDPRFSEKERKKVYNHRNNKKNHKGKKTKKTTQTLMINAVKIRNNVYKIQITKVKNKLDTLIEEPEKSIIIIRKDFSVRIYKGKK